MIETNWSRDGLRLKSDNLRRFCRLQNRAVQGRSKSRWRGISHRRGGREARLKKTARERESEKEEYEENEKKRKKERENARWQETGADEQDNRCWKKDRKRENRRTRERQRQCNIYIYIYIHIYIHIYINM